MAILIPNMDMPKSCSECPFENGGYLGTCKLLHESFYWEKPDLSDCRTWTRRHFDFLHERLPGCPLKPMYFGYAIERRVIAEFNKALEAREDPLSSKTTFSEEGLKRLIKTIWKQTYRKELDDIFSMRSKEKED